MCFSGHGLPGNKEVLWISSFTRVNRNTETLMPYILMLFSACNLFFHV